MKLKTFFIFTILITILIGSITTKAQYEPIPTGQIPNKIKELSNSELKDSVFWATIGFFREEKIRFATVLENTMYVGEEGFFYRIDVADSKGNVTASCTFFSPHNRQIPPENPDTNYVFLPNEHLCLCKAKIGYAKTVKEGKGFSCESSVKLNDDEENVDVECHDIETMQKYIARHYKSGIEYKPKLSVIPITIKPLTED